MLPANCAVLVQGFVQMVLRRSAALFVTEACVQCAHTNVRVRCGCGSARLSLALPVVLLCAWALLRAVVFVQGFMQMVLRLAQVALCCFSQVQHRAARVAP